MNFITWAIDGMDAVCLITLYIHYENEGRTSVTGSWNIGNIGKYSSKMCTARFPPLDVSTSRGTVGSMSVG